MDGLLVIISGKYHEMDDDRGVFTPSTISHEWMVWDGLTMVP